MTPAQNSIAKVGINFGAVVLAVWVADLSMTAFKNYQARKASKESAPAGSGGAPPASAPAGK